MYLYIFHLMCYNIYNYDFEDEYEDTEVEYLDDTPKEDESV